MELGCFWKNQQDNGYNGRLRLDVDVVLKAGVDYNLYLNEVDKKDNSKLPDYRLNLKQK